MTVIDQPLLANESATEAPQRFIFDDVDWAFYENVGDKLADRHVFATYFKGRLEIVTVSFLHERMTALLVIMIRVMAEEMSLALLSAGMTTLKRVDLDEGVEPDSSFYTKHAERMRGKKVLDLAVDPPPDLAVEIEVTRRLGSRQSIYQDMGVPEIWLCSTKRLSVLIRSGSNYIAADRSPTFPLLSPDELFSIADSGLTEDETAFAKAFRVRIQKVLAGKS